MFNRDLQERYGASDMRKAANRVNFNVAEEEIGFEGEGLGLLGTSAGMAAAGGKLRMSAKPAKLKVAKNEKNFKKTSYGSSGATSGLSSSLAFTPIQGIELVNPNKDKDGASGTDSVFNEFRGFSKVQRQLKVGAPHA